MNSQKERRTLFILHVLTAYILLQVCWWGYMLVDVNNQLSKAQGIPPENNRALWMVLGEGSVFLILLALGFWRIRKNVISELHFARVQRTFLLAVTHELKTPVAAVKLLLETLRTREVTPEKAQKIITDALKETNRLEGLTGNILLVTRLDHTDSEQIPGSSDLSSMLQGEANRFKQLHAETRTFILDILPDITIPGEPELLRALCFNLIDNAVKYTTDAGIIRISLQTRQSIAKLAISDNGPGIPEEEKKRIFDKFYRIGNEATRKHKGTGLGLYIVQSTVRLHKGSVEVSDTPGGGTTFTVELPLHHGIN